MIMHMTQPVIIVIVQDRRLEDACVVLRHP